MQVAQRLAAAIAGGILLTAACSAQDTSRPLFRQLRSNKIENFTAASRTHRFDVVNADKCYLMLVFEPNASAELSPNVIRLAPKERATVRMAAGPGVKSFKLGYAVSLSSTPFKTHTNRYRAYSDGETVMC
ncbi:MAG: hypothetical protein WCT12_08790, partial [Verrucomicrobiota bacterium]